MFLKAVVKEPVLFCLKQHIPFQDTERKSSQDEPPYATYISPTTPEIEVHEGII